MKNSEQPFDQTARTIIRATSEGVEVIQHGEVVSLAADIGTGMFDARGNSIGEEFISTKAYRETVSELYTKFAAAQQAIDERADYTPQYCIVLHQEAADSLGEDITAAREGLQDNLKLWKEGNPSLLRTVKKTASEVTAEQLTILNIRQEVQALVQQSTPASEMYRYLARAVMSKDETRLDATLNAISLHVPEGMDADSLHLHGTVQKYAERRPDAIRLRQFQRNEELYNEATSQLETIEGMELLAYMQEHNCPGPSGETLEQVSRSMSAHQPKLEAWEPEEGLAEAPKVPAADVTGKVVGDGVEHPKDSTTEE